MAGSIPWLCSKALPVQRYAVGLVYSTPRRGSSSGKFGQNFQSIPLRHAGWGRLGWFQRRGQQFNQVGLGPDGGLKGRAGQDEPVVGPALAHGRRGALDLYAREIDRRAFGPPCREPAPDKVS